MSGGELVSTGGIVPFGRDLDGKDRAEVQKAVDLARSISGYAFAVYVGPLAQGRDSAIERHAGMTNPASLVLVAVDPAARVIEIVTGANVHIVLDDHACELAALSMKSDFVDGDLVPGLRTGLIMLAEHTRTPHSRHLTDF